MSRTKPPPPPVRLTAGTVNKDSTHGKQHVAIVYGVLGTAREQRPEKAVATRIEGLGNMGWWVQRLRGLPLCLRDSAEAGAEARGCRARKAAGRPGEGLAGCAGSGSSWLEVCVSAGVGGVTGPPWCWEQTQRASCWEACRPGGEAGAWQVLGGLKGERAGVCRPLRFRTGQAEWGLPGTWLPCLPPPPGAQCPWPPPHCGTVKLEFTGSSREEGSLQETLSEGVLVSSQLESLTNSPLFSF